MTNPDNESIGPAWCATAPPLDLPVRCGGAVHQLRWQKGEVTLADHKNLDAELALVAFGGAEPPCVARYRLWEDAIEDGGFLGEWVDDTRLRESWFSWLGMALERMRSEGFHEFLRGLPPNRAQRMGEFLHGFPVPWIDRAAAEVNHRVVDGAGVSCSQAVGLLRDGTAQRVRRAFVDAVGGRQLSVGAAALVPLSITVADEGPAVGGRLRGRDRGVALTVPATWLHRVRAAGAAVIDGELVLDIDRFDGGAADALVVCWVDDHVHNRAVGPTPILTTRPVTFDGTAWRRR
ncbi:MAG: hypothetical protein AAF531_23755 [Actinomycetota bacterium]